MLINIIIPTIKRREDIYQQCSEIFKTVKHEAEIVPICSNKSAAINRNMGLRFSKHEIIIMLDDDITGFYQGWDYDLINPLLNDINISIVSARLLNKNKQIGSMLGDNNNKVTGDYQIALHTDQTGLNIVCSACIAFKKDTIYFDENYQGAVYEDTDFCMQYKQKYPDKQIVINNKCQLIHLNEMKGRTYQDIKSNKEYFSKKWNIVI
jgi:hypothetical protein